MKDLKVKKTAALIFLFLAVLLLFGAYRQSQRTIGTADIEGYREIPHLTPPVPTPPPVAEEAYARKGLGALSLLSRGETKSQQAYAIDRKIIKTSYLSIEVEDFQTASDEITRIIEEAGGFIADSSLHVSDSGHRRGTITARVPQSGFLDVVGELMKVGDVKSKNIRGEDVTEEYIDLDARLENYQKQEESLLKLLDKAEDVEDILGVEEQLWRVRGEIERLTGRKRYLDNRIELSTITIDLYEPLPITQTWGLRETIRDAVKAFISMFNAIIVFTGFVLPLVIVFSIAYLIYRLVKKGKARPKDV